MARDHQHNPYPNVNAARIVGGQPACRRDRRGVSLARLAHIQKVDERGLTLLRAAFEVGWKAGRRQRALRFAKMVKQR